MTSLKQILLFFIFLLTPHILQFSLPGVSIGQTTNAATKNSPKEVMHRLQRTYDKINNLNFSFTQAIRGPLSGRNKRGYGEAFFIRDKQGGKMRWNYYGDEPQVLLSDGQDFLMYFGKLHQMIITPVETMRQDILYSFFTGTSKLEDNFSPSAADSTVAFTQLPDNLSYDVIKLTPKENQSQVNSIHLFITKDSLIRRIEIKDHFDTLTILNFADFKLNKLDSENTDSLRELFSFTPPDGTEIIHQ